MYLTTKMVESLGEAARRSPCVWAVLSLALMETLEDVRGELNVRREELLMANIRESAQAGPYLGSADIEGMGI